MNIFDIIGPIMVGPSSSHTAGLVRIGAAVNKIIGTVPSVIEIKFHGSLAKTYKGHGSDKAVIAGLMGFQPDDERIKDSLTIASKEGIKYSFSTIELPDAHPNTVIITTEANGNITNVRAESTGGGNILIRNIDDIEIGFDGQYDTLIIRHTDTPGAISLVTNVLAVMKVNVATMKVSRSQKGGDAVMIIGADGQLDKSLGTIIESLPNIKRAVVIWGIKH